MQCLESSFDVFACTDLFHWIQAAKKTGELRVSHEAAIRRIYVANGRIVACSSNEPRLLPGPYLVAHGWIDAAALKGCMEGHATSGRSVGSLLVEQGKIAEIDLRTTLAARAEEVIVGVFEWPRGNFRFEADRVTPSDVMSVEMSVEAALQAGASRCEAWSRIRSLFHSPHLIVQKRGGGGAPPGFTSHLDTALFQSVDGRRTLAEIASVCGTSEYAAGSFLADQVERGLVQVRNVRGPEVDLGDVGNLFNALRELLASDEYEAAVEWIDRYRLKPDGDEFLSMLIAKAEAGFLAGAYRNAIPPDAVPRRVRADEPPGRQIALLHSEDLLLLDLVDGHWDVRSLGWIAPIRKIDVVRGLLRLRKHGLIELQLPFGEAGPAHQPDARRDEEAGAGSAFADIERAVGELGI